MSKQIKKKNDKRITSIAVAVILTIVAWIICSISVYGKIDPIATLRSETMKKVVVPILTAIITFIGVAYSVRKTVNSSVEQQKENFKEETKKMNKTFNKQQELKTNELLAQERYKENENLVKNASQYFKIITEIENSMLDDDVQSKFKLAADITLYESLLIFSFDEKNTNEKIIIDKLEKTTQNAVGILNLKKSKNKATYSKEETGAINKDVDGKKDLMEAISQHIKSNVKKNMFDQ